MKQILILMILTITAAQALADDIHLQINGAIMAASCEVEGGSKNKTVEMGEALASDFSQPHDWGPRVPFELSVINCPATITAVEAAFSGVRDPHENNAYLNNGTGRGLALQIIESNSGMYMLPDGEPATAPVDPTTHSATWDFSARYIRTTDAFAPGSFDTAVQVTFTYR